MVLLDQCQFFCGKKTFNQQYGLAVARIPQAYRSIQFQQRKPVRTLECTGSAQQSVTVGIGLDYCHHACAGGVAANYGQILFERGKIDQGLDGTRHLFNS